jgi:hypothetical protein
MAFESNETELRRIERDILDPFHSSLPLFQRDRSEARLGLLAAFDSMAFVSMVAQDMGREPDASSRQLEKKAEDGLAQAMRWVTHTEEKPFVSRKYSPGLLNDAGEALLHAADYANLADFHRLYGAKMVLAEVDEPRRRIRFRYERAELGFEAAMGFMSSVSHELVQLNGENRPRAAIKPQQPVGYNMEWSD